MSDRWTDETLALVVETLYEGDGMPARDKARDVLNALADAGLLVEPCGETAGITAHRCDYTDRDLSTNRPLRCDKAAGHTTHRLVWEES
jgi:hypothetical protein